MDEHLSRAASAIREAEHVAVMTGAGVSAESRIPTFRDTMEGLWKEFDPQTLATPEAFAGDPETVSRWYDWRRLKCLEAEPNPGHLALAELERMIVARGGRFTLLTQNVDRLHQKAGSRNVVELHGTIMVWRCTECGREFEPAPEAFDAFPVPSECHEGALLRPCVVWFGEMLPEQAVSVAHEASSTCDVFISIGTSSVVYPAAGFIESASMRGASTGEVNPAETPMSTRVDWRLEGPSGAMLPRLVKAIAST